MELKDLKKAYRESAKKYKLPEFKEINECFEIDRIDRDTDVILRDVRKVMMDKIVGYKRFLEMMIAPASASPTFLMFIKEVTKEDQSQIESVFKKLTELELDSLDLEIDFSEKAEAEMIKKIYEAWSDLKLGLKKISVMMRRNWMSASKKNDRAYFG